MRKRNSLITVFEARAGGVIESLIITIVEGGICARSDYMRARGPGGLTISAKVAGFFAHCRVGIMRIRGGQFTGTLLAFAAVFGGAMGSTCIDTVRGLIGTGPPALGGHLISAEVMSAL